MTTAAILVLAAACVPVAVAAVVAMWRGRRRNVTVVRGKAEGPVVFPTEFAKWRGELCGDDDDVPLTAEQRARIRAKVERNAKELEGLP